MGTSLNGLTPAGTYPGLIKTGDNAPIDGTLKTLSDGNGNNLPMAVSTTAVNFTNQLQQGGVAVPTASQVNAKQDTLVSGTNIKTINGTSLLGSGNIPVVTSPSGIAGAIQFSNGSAFASDAANLFWDDTNNRLGVGTNAPSTTVDILPPTQTAIATQFDCFRVGYSNSTIGVTNFPAFQVQVATTGTSRFSTTLRLSGGSDTSQAYLKGFDSNLFGVMLNRAQSNLGLFSDNGIMLGNTAFAGSEGSASAQVHIKGSGTTSGTTSLLVQNSAGTNWLQVKDDGDITNGANGSSELKFEISPVANKFFRLTRQSTNVDFYAGNGGNAAIETSGGQPFSLIASSAYLTLSNGGVSIGATLNTTNTSAILDVTSTTKGVLFPRMTTTQRDLISSVATGLVLYNTTTNKLQCYNGSTWNDLF